MKTASTGLRAIARFLPIALLVVACDSDGGRSIVGPEPTADPQLEIQAVSGSGQAGEVATKLPSPLVVKVQDGDRKPVAGARVTWTVAGEGQLSATSTPTDANGLASVDWVLGRTAGAQSVSAKLGDSSPVQFAGTAHPGRAASVTLTPSPVVLNRGTTERVSVAIRDGFGNLITGRQHAMRSAHPDIAPLNAGAPAHDQESLHLMVAGSRAGTTVITVEAEGVAGSAPVSVVESTTAAPTLTVVGGNGQTGTAGAAAADPLTVRLLLPDNTPVTGKTVRFAVASGGGSVDATSVTTDGQGSASVRFVFGPRAGTHTVTAVVEGIAPVSFILNAVAGAATSVSVTPATLSIARGATALLTVTAADAGGNAVSGRTALFTSADPSVASVNASGVVTGANAGITTITVRVDGATTNVPVTVTASTAPSVATLAITPALVDVRVGASAQLTVVGRDAAGNTIAGLSFALTTSDPTIASVSANGIVVGVAPGTATVTATAGGVTATAEVRVSAASAPVASVTVTPSPVALQVGSVVNLSVVARDAGGNAISGLPATITSSNPAVVFVGSNGALTGVAAGTATVTVTVGGVSTGVLVTVTAGPPTATVASVTITPSPLSLKVGASATLSVVARDAAGNVITGLPATLSTSNAAVAALGANGLVVGAAAGTATVTATVGGVSATVQVTVTADPPAPTVATVTITPSPLALRVGASATLSVVAKDASGTAIPGLTATLSSSNAGIATVGANGVVTGVSAGTATITATVSGVSATVLVTVTADTQNPTVASVTISPSPVSLRVGASTQLNVVARDTSGKVITGLTASLTSSAPSVVSVGANGTITGVAAGTATITATVLGVTATVQVTVTAEPTAPTVARVEITPSPLSLRVGASAQLNVVAKDAAGNVLTGLPVTLSTSNATVASLGANGIVNGVTAGIATITATVGGVSATVQVTVTADPPVPTVSTVTISPSPLALRVGASATLSVVARDANGNALTGLTATLTSSNPAVASVGANGTVTGNAAGAATITATVGGVSATVQVTVTAEPTAPTVARVEITPSPLSLRVGASAQLNVVAKDAAGNVFTGLPVTLSTSNAAVASLAANGIVNGVAAGNATITATVGGVSATVQVTVTADPPAQTVATVTISPSPLALRVGASATLSVVARDANGNALTGLTATLTSSNPSVASVGANGTVTGNAAGTATITATVGSVSATVQVTVTAEPTAPTVTSVTISPSPVSLRVGETERLTVVAKDAAGNAISGLPATLTSSNPLVAAVGANGTVLGLLPGNATVTATVAGVSATVQVTVTALPPVVVVGSVTVSPSPVSLRVGASVQLSVSARDTLGNVLSGLPATLTSSNPGVVSVGANGMITGVAAGTATITATVGGVSTTVQVTVTAEPTTPTVSTVTISPSPLGLRVGASATLSVVARDANGNPLTGLTATLTSSNPAVASVGANGTVTGNTAGTATITATVGGVSATVQVKVTAEPTAPTVASVTISPSPVSLRVGETEQLTVVAKDAAGNAISGLPATLTSSNPLVAAVGANGTVLGLLPGTATVTATVAGVTARVQVTVTAIPPTVVVGTVTVSPSPVTLRVGGSIQLSVSARDTLGNVLSGLGVTLASSNPGVVSVGANGTITGVAAGTATITATVLGVSTTVQVTVTADPPAPVVASVTISPSPLSLKVGETERLTVVAREADGTAIPGLTATITSSNPAVALVGLNGSVTGVLPGTATVRATVAGVSATAQVTVTAEVPPLVVGTVTITPSPISVRVGASLPVSIVARDPLGNVLTGLTATLTSSNSSVVSIGANGTITGVAAGTATITATVLGVSATVQVTVTADPPAATVATVTISPSPLSLRVGTSAPLSIVARDAGGNVLAGLTATLTSSNPAVATVNRGTVTGVAVGSATVTATVAGISATVPVTVTADPEALVKLTLSPSPLTLWVGAATRLNLVATDLLGNLLPILGATFTSSDRTIVSVDANGNVTGLAAGTATITATLLGISATVQVTVAEAAAPVASVTVTPAPVSLGIGGSQKLTVVARDAAGNLLAGLPVTFASDNPLVALVGADGTVRGLLLGSTDVTVTVGGVTQRVRVNVRL